MQFSVPLFGVNDSFDSMNLENASASVYFPSHIPVCQAVSALFFRLPGIRSKTVSPKSHTVLPDSPFSIF